MQSDRPFARARGAISAAAAAIAGAAGTPLVGALAALLAAAPGPEGAAAEPAPELSFVYVEGNVGGASGGHSALRFGDVAFDFEVGPEQSLRLRREPWEHMRYRYTTLYNRPVHVATLRLQPSAWRRARDGFAARYLLQQAARDAARESARDVLLAEARVGRRSGFPVPAAGLLDPRRPAAPAALALRRHVEAARGAGFLSAALARAEVAGRAAARSGNLRRERELLAEREALRALEAGFALAEDIVLAPEGEPLSALERAALEALQRRLAVSVVSLLASARPDRGSELLRSAARYQVVSRSLAEGRLLLLDAMPDEPPTFDARAAALRRDELAALAGRHRLAFRRARSAELAGPTVSEPGWSRLEGLASRANEYAHGARSGRPVREPAERLAPERAREVEVATWEGGERAADARGALARAQAAARAARRALREAHRYDVFRSNCATELVRELEAHLGGPDGLAQALGGRIAPGEAGGFVPFVLQRQVEQRLPVVASERIASHRERALAELRAREGAARVALREGNVLTSRVYRWRDRDTRFLFFTSDVFWPRPLYGAANLLYALPDTALGLVAAPLDRGRRLRRGAYGVLYSLPELAFFNVRKGSFDAATLPRGERGSNR